MYKRMLIDFVNEDGEFERVEIDDMELSIRDGMAWFYSNGKKMTIELEEIVQIFTA